jgi:hypothetical protein
MKIDRQLPFRRDLVTELVKVHVKPVRYIILLKGISLWTGVFIPPPSNFFSTRPSTSPLSSRRGVGGEVSTDASLLGRSDHKKHK